MMDDWVTQAIAVCALVVAAATAGWNIYRDGFRDRARLRLSLFRGYFPQWAGMPPQPGIPSPDKPVVIVKAANVGRRPVTITGGGGIEFPEGVRGLFTSPVWAVPKKLEEGESVTLFNPEESLQKLIREHGVPTHIWFTDATDKTHRKRIPGGLKPWLEGLSKKEASEVVG